MPGYHAALNTAKYQTPLDQAWLGLWVSLYGPGSRLRGYLNGDPIPRPGVVEARKRHRTPREQKQRPRSKVERAARRIEQDVARVARLPLSDWAKRIVDDPRINAITLTDILSGVEDYFGVFAELKRYDPEVSAYFSRVGAPIVLDNMRARSNLDALELGNPGRLPSYCGVFLCRRQDKWREQVVAAEDDTSPEAWTAYDFHLFEKVKTHAAAAPFGTTVFRYTQYSIKRDVFSPGDLKPDHWASKTWGVSWFVGVLPDGQVKALPVRCSSVQPLPNGGDICHSAFKIPKGLSGWARETAKRNGEDIDHHGLAQRALNVSIAFAAAAAAGVQVTVSKGKNRARFGLPVSSLKNFFGNRDRDPGGRRQPILHYLPSHARHLSDGRIVEVGEHLRGKRFFTWRGYDIQVAVPGIHYPSPEGFTAELYDPDLPHLPKNLISTPAVAKKMAAAMDDSGFVAIRQGTPTITRTAPSFPEGTK